jgi:hypothetical protein
MELSEETKNILGKYLIKRMENLDIRAEEIRKRREETRRKNPFLFKKLI